MKIKNRILLFLGLAAVSPVFGQAAEFAPSEVPEELPVTMRPTWRTVLPTELRDVDYFGRVRDPRLEVYDPLSSALYRDGRDPSAEALPDGRVLMDLSHRHVVQYGSLPTIAVTAGRAVSVLLMRNGQVVKPPFTVVPPPAGMVRVISSPESPYLYFQAPDEVEFPDNFPYTHVFVSMELEKRPVQFQIRLKVVRPSSSELVPLVILDMTGDFPDVLPDADASAPRASVPAPVPSAAPGAPAVSASAPSPAEQYVFQGRGHAGPTPRRGLFSKEEVGRFLPTMIEMAKLYERAVHDRAPGYSQDEIQRFTPSSVKDGRVVKGTVYGFRDLSTGLVSWLPWGYWFPKYDAIVYELVVDNTSPGDVWFDYSLLKLLFGFESSSTPLPGMSRLVVVSPDEQEVTPAGRSSVFWVLCQGSGINPVSTPVRLVFPEMMSSERDLAHPPVYWAPGSPEAMPAPRSRSSTR